MKFRRVAVVAAVIILILAGWMIVHFIGGNSAASLESNSQPGAHVDGSKRSKRPRSESADSSRPLPETARRTSWLSKAGKLPSLSDEQIASFLQESNRSANALLAVFRIRENMDDLREAAKSFPNDKTVQLELAIRGTDPEEKLTALERFRDLDPNNSMGDYLAALSAYQQGKQEDALAELEKAESHTLFGFPLADVHQGIEELYLSANYTPVEAKAAALFGQPNFYITSLYQLAGYFANSLVQAEQDGDAESLKHWLGMGMNLSRRVSGTSKLLSTEMMGIAIETKILRSVPENTKLPNSSITASHRLEQLDLARKEITSLTTGLEEIQKDMNEGDFFKYLKRIENDGEAEALRELRDKKGL